MRTMTMLAMLGAAVAVPRASFAHGRDHGGGHFGGGFGHAAPVAFHGGGHWNGGGGHWNGGGAHWSGGVGWGHGGGWGAPVVVRPRVFVPGYWNWRNNQRIWVDGAWAIPPADGSVWVAPRWVWNAAAGQWVWQEGYWTTPGAPAYGY